jgi:hypothetical protein
MTHLRHRARGRDDANERTIERETTCAANGAGSGPRGSFDPEVRESAVERRDVGDVDERGDGGDRNQLAVRHCGRERVLRRAAVDHGEAAALVAVVPVTARASAPILVRVRAMTRGSGGRRNDRGHRRAHGGRENAAEDEGGNEHARGTTKPASEPLAALLSSTDRAHGRKTSGGRGLFRL